MDKVRKIRRTLCVYFLIFSRNVDIGARRDNQGVMLKRLQGDERFTKRSHVVVHRELVRMWAETERVVFLLLHVDPVGDEVGVEDVAAQEEGMISLERFDRSAE